jgi:heme-degrading monooxygenase HmoA
MRRVLGGASIQDATVKPAEEKGGDGMFARVSTYRGSPERTDEGIRLARESILPRVHRLDGYEGTYYLVDRRSGKAISMTLWESEEAMRASEEAADQLRSESAEATSATVESVERYEVAISPEHPAGEIPRIPPGPEEQIYDG